MCYNTGITEEKTLSVTFSASETELMGWSLQCVCGAKQENAAVLSYQEGLAALEAHRANPYAMAESCDSFCLEYGGQLQAITVGPESEQLNVNNGNAASLLEVLGLVQPGDTFEDYCVGACSGEDFLGRVLLARGVAPESAEIPTYGEGNVIFCGRPAGYVQQALEKLQSIAEFAVAEQREVHWG